MKNLFLITSLFLSSVCLAAEISGTVTKVSDGDTFTIKVDEDKFRVRMENIDAPEVSQPWGEKSKSALAAMIESKQVYVEFHTIDTFGRIVGTVYTRKVFGKYYDCVNKAMVSKGWAFWFKQYSKDLDYFKLQEEAREHKLGVWSDSVIEYPWDYRKQKREEKKQTGKE